MQRRIPRRHRLPDDAELFPIVRTYIKEVLGPRLNTLPIEMINIVFDDFKLTQIRASSPKDFASWCTHARDHHLKRNNHMSEVPALNEFKLIRKLFQQHEGLTNERAEQAYSDSILCAAMRADPNLYEQWRKDAFRNASLLVPGL